MERRMGRRSRTLVALLAVALGAMLPATCPCVPQASPHTGHECCAPSTALRALDSDCCGGKSILSEALALPSAPDAALSTASCSVVIATLPVAPAPSGRPATPAPSPPPLILRI
jgi:hypothetical protein